MKKITLLFFALAAFCWQSNAQSIASQQFYASGYDDDNFQLIINDSDITANLGQPIQSITILNYEAHYSSTTGTQPCLEGYEWFYFDLVVTGGVATGLTVTDGCEDDYIGLDVSGFTNLTFTSNDPDVYSDFVHLYVTLEVTYQTPLCTQAVVDSSTVVDDCGNSQFSIDVDVTTVGDATHISNGSNTWPISGTGVVTVGPFVSGTLQSLTVVHSDSACDLSIGSFEYECPQVVVCGAPVNVTHCYGDSEDETWTFMSSDGSPLKVDFIEGYFEDCCDEIYIYDGADTSATILFQSDSSYGDDATGITATSTGDTVTVRIDSDGSVSCDDGSGSPALNFNVACLSCSPAEATAIVVEDCNTSTFTIDVTVTEIGDATAITDGTTPQAVAMSLTFGPYAFGTSITLDIEHSDINCNFTLGTYTYQACPPVNNVPSGAITLTLDEGTACGANAITGISNAATSDSGEAAPSCGNYFPTSTNGDLWYQFVAPATDLTLGVTNVTGMTTVSGVLYSGTPGSFTEVAPCGNSWPKAYSGLTVSETYYLRVWDYGNDQTGTFSLCGYYLNCAQGEATASVTDDCGNNTFTIAVDVTTLGDITHVNDGTTSHLVVAGMNTLPVTYNFGDSITLTAEHSNAACDFEIGVFSEEGNCPPACGDSFYDTGGASASYSNSEDYTVTICPDVTGDGVTVTFNSFLVEGNGSGNCWDFLYIYDGDDTTGTPITPQSLGLNPGATATAFCWQSAGDGTADLTGQAITATNASGCLTFRFTSDSSGMYAGWDASVSCATMGVQDIGGNKLFTYYPNPVSNTLTLNAQRNIQSVSVMNMLGQEVLKATPNTLNSVLDMSNLTSGAYFVNVTVEGVSKTIRIIKN